MGLLNWIIEKMSEPDKTAQGRVHAETLIERLNQPGVESVELTLNEVTQLRKHIAERLGRELADTPAPDNYNGIQIILPSEK